MFPSVNDVGNGAGYARVCVGHGNGKPLSRCLNFPVNLKLL